MIQKRFVSLLLCAALALCLLAGCDTAASGSTGSASAPAALLTDKDSLSGRIEDAGLDPADLPGCSEKNWDALQDVIDRLTPEAKGEF